MRTLRMITTIGILLIRINANAHCCWTKDNPGFYDLRIVLQNVGTEQCSLTQSMIQQGVLYGSTIPPILPATGEATSVTLSGSEVQVTLTYQCGQDKRISLQMKQWVKRGHKHTSIDAISLDTNNVFETHTVKPNTLGCCSTHDRYGLVSWTLTH